jgi:hypothetical protein
VPSEMFCTSIGLPTFVAMVDPLSFGGLADTTGARVLNST